MDTKHRSREVIQADMVKAMVDNLAEHIRLRENRANAKGVDCPGHSYPLFEGCAPSQLKKDIQHIRRELLNLSKMIDGDYPTTV